MTETGLTPATPANSGPYSTGLQFSLSGDLLAQLPNGAADKLRALRQRFDDSHSLVPEFEQIREASAAKQHAEHALERLTAHRSVGGFELDDEDGRVIGARKTRDKATADFRRLQELQTARSQAWQAASAALQSVESWLRDGRPPGTTLRDYEGEAPSLNKGESLLDAIEPRRRRCRELRADRARISAAPYPSSYCKQRAREQIEILAARGAVIVSNLVEHDGPIEFPTQVLRVPVSGAAPGAVGSVEVIDTLGLFAAVFRDALIERLDAEIDAEADDKSALSHADRQKREAEVLSDLLDIERQEASLVWSAQAQGLPCEHRAECSPEAILSLRLVSAAAPVYERGSSLEHALQIIGLR